MAANDERLSVAQRLQARMDEERRTRPEREAKARQALQHQLELDAAKRQGPN